MQIIALFSYPALAGPIETTQQYAEGEVLVVLDAPAESDYLVMGTFNRNAYSSAITYQADGFTRARGLEARNTYPEIARVSGKSIIHIRSENKTTDQLIRELSSAPGVISVSPNRKSELIRTPNDPYYPLLWGMVNIKMPQVWDYVIGSEQIVVAVLDSGIDYNHPDLAANITKDSYGNYGRRFENGTWSNDPMDVNGHGTHVAGTIGAVGNNGIGVVGVNWQVKMLAVNAFPYGGAWDADIINGINYIHGEKTRGLNIRVVNMSFRGLYSNMPNNDPYTMAMKSLNDANIICVIAAGNDSYDLNNPYLPHRPYPASFKFSNNITVGAIANGDVKSSFSNYGDNWVDIAAPGSVIYSALPNNVYGYMDGTSMAAPHVAGAAAILCAAYPSESASIIKARILQGGRNVGYLNAGYWANGVLDVWSAYNTVPVTGGWIEFMSSYSPSSNQLHGNGSTFWYPDYYTFVFNSVGFIPYPYNATINSIKWESTTFTLNNPNQIVTTIYDSNDNYFGYLSVKVNETYTLKIPFEYYPKK